MCFVPSQSKQEDVVPELTVQYTSAKYKFDAEANMALRSPLYRRPPFGYASALPDCNFFSIHEFFQYHTQSCDTPIRGSAGMLDLLV